MKIYRGVRDGPSTADEVEVTVEETGQAIRPLAVRLDVANHSPDGFNWGYWGSGPAQLALALLLDHLGEEGRSLAVRLYQKFKSDIIAKLPLDEWEIHGEDIAAWLADNPIV